MIMLSRETGRVSGGASYTYIDGVYVFVNTTNNIVDTEGISAFDCFGGLRDEFYYGPLIEMVD